MWLRYEDINSSYFHAFMKSKMKRNTITTLCVGNSWMNKVVEVRDEVVKFFTNDFS